MKLLITTKVRAAIGGVETYVRGIAPALAARGHQVALLFEHRHEPTNAEDAFAGCAAEWCLEEDGDAGLAAARTWRPDLVWNQGCESSALESGFLELAPAIYYAHNYDGLCATGAKFHRRPTAVSCTRSMGAGCVAINWTRGCGMPNPWGFGASFLRQLDRAKLMRQYVLIMVASRHMEAALAEHLGSDKAVRVVGYPLFSESVATPSVRPEPPSRILMAARMTSAKGGDLLLHATAITQRELARRLDVTVCGDGPALDALRRQARELGLAVTFTGWVNANERQRLLDMTDLLVVPSVWPEPFGMIGIEAAARAVPAVAFAVGGIADWLSPGVHGEVAPGAPPTQEGLASAMVRALGRREHLEQLRRGALEGVARFRLPAHIDVLEAVMEEALRKT